MKILGILIVLHQIFQIRTGHIFDLLNDPLKDLYGVAIIKSTNTSYNVKYNEEYQMNRSEIYIKGIFLDSLVKNNLLNGWNTTQYIGEF
jgi:hypothetical protein